MHANNMWHELLTQLPSPKMPRLHEFQCPMKHAILGFFWKPVKILLPHELFACIYHSFPKVWTAFVYHSKQRCRQFWQDVCDTEQFRTHPVRHRENYSTKCVPMKIHGDGTPVVSLGKSWSKMVDIYSICSMLTWGPTCLRNFLIWMIHQSLS